MGVPACKDCRHCTDNGSGNFHEFTCAAVTDPFNGAPLPVGVARREVWQGFTLPCGYNGDLFEAK